MIVAPVQPTFAYCFYACSSICSHRNLRFPDRYVFDQQPNLCTQESILSNKSAKTETWISAWLTVMLVQWWWLIRLRNSDLDGPVIPHLPRTNHYKPIGITTDSHSRIVLTIVSISSMKMVSFSILLITVNLNVLWV